MKVEGAQDLPASRQRVWDMLMDPAVLARCLPGCEKLEPIGENSYRASLKIGLAAIKGGYTGTVNLSELSHPKSFKMTLEGKGSPGFVRGTAVIKLAEQGDTTELQYSGEVQVGGLIASIGQRMLQGMTTTMLHHFFEAFEREVRGSSTT
ncbi:MAG: SRPBCC family protein [Gammaproteobacteria bacterium]